MPNPDPNGQIDPAGSIPELGRILEDSINEIYIFDAETLRYSFANRAARENLGYSMDELQAATPLDLKPQFTPDSFAQRLHPLRSGERQTVVFETYHRRKDGSHYPVDVVLHLGSYCGAASFVAIIVDSSAMNAAKLALRESEELHRLTLENISDAVFITDETGSFRYVCPNVHVIFGHSVDEVRSMGNLCALLGDLARIQVNVPEISNIATQINDHEGREHDLLVNIKRVDIRGGTRLYSCRDVTELKRMQDRLVQSERLAAIGQMVTALTHESRNAIQRIMANVELLVDEMGEDTRELRKIASACNDLRLLHEEIRDYAAPLRLDIDTYQLDAIAHRAWRELETVREGRDAVLDVDFTATDASCRADGRRLTQVFRNLFENSLAATTDMLRITLDGRDSEPDLIEIRVRDNGPGFSADAREGAFDPFFTTKPAGTGLGLAIVRRIVEQHGGQIALGNSPTGAEIVITLPRSASEQP